MGLGTRPYFNATAAAMASGAPPALFLANTTREGTDAADESPTPDKNVRSLPYSLGITPSRTMISLENRWDATCSRASRSATSSEAPQNSQRQKGFVPLSP